jgi:hypothetical protein
MAINPDFRDLFAALNAAGADYLLVGGYAVSLHSAPRFTKDLDVFIRADSANAARVFAALQAFGSPHGDLQVGDLAAPGTVFQIGIAPNRIDILTSIDGVAFEEAWAGRTSTLYGGQAVPVIGKTELLRNKLAAGRPQDLLDADALRK